MPDPNKKKGVLPVIIFAQFAGTSLWFAGNAVMTDLQKAFHLPLSALGNMTSAVQFGFIAGTLTFAFFLIADRFSPSRVFLLSALMGAFFNVMLYFIPGNFNILILLRFLTGFFLAGIYPVGMKIAADWFAEDLGKALGFLVGALVLGTAFPHFVRHQAGSLPWQLIIMATSALAALGGILLFAVVPDGPYRKPGAGFQPRAIARIFDYPGFRAAAFGYFGHMWELYALWAYIPLILIAYGRTSQISLWSFAIIGTGALGCIAGGYFSQRSGSDRVAFYMLLISGICCLLSPLFFYLPEYLFFPVLLIWGFTVVGDSPQFSTLVAKTAPAAFIGSALTIVNCIGFSITIFSIEGINLLRSVLDEKILYLFLLPGPLFGLLSINRLMKGRVQSAKK